MLEIIELSPGEIAPMSSASSIYLVKQGEVKLSTKDGVTVEQVTIRSFFGEEAFFPDAGHSLQARAVDHVELFQIQDYPLDQIPVVLWKLLETAVRRRSTQASVTSSANQ